MALKNTCEESLREIEAAHPVAVRRLVVEPLSDEVDPCQQVLEPRGERFEGRVTDLPPDARQHVVLEGKVHFVQFLRHHCQALDGLLQFVESRGHLPDEDVELGHLLQQNDR
jgi:hypothetical protein